jgi:hypothetical protein
MLVRRCDSKSLATRLFEVSRCTISYRCVSLVRLKSFTERALTRISVSRFLDNGLPSPWQTRKRPKLGHVTSLKSETKLYLLANIRDIRQNCRHNRMLGRKLKGPSEMDSE